MIVLLEISRRFKDACCKGKMEGCCCCWEGACRPNVQLIVAAALDGRCQ